MSDKYELIGQTPVPVEDLLEWARKLGTMDRKVALTRLFGFCDVSTVFLGLDHNWGGGPPLLFETMVFWEGEGGYEQKRCSTWKQAEKQHARMCAEASRPAAVVRHVSRRLRDWWHQAELDLRHRWREMRGIELTDMEKLSMSLEDPPERF